MKKYIIPICIWVVLIYSSFSLGGVIFTKWDGWRKTAVDLDNMKGATAVRIYSLSSKEWQYFEIFRVNVENYEEMTKLIEEEKEFDIEINIKVQE